MKFLCAQHRQHILSTPEAMLDYWHEWMQAGSSLLEAGDCDRASRYLGSSFELAEDMLNHPLCADSQTMDALVRYMVSGHHLAECLGRNTDPEQELHYLLTVHMELVDWIKSRRPQFWLLRQHLQISLIMLHRYVKRHGSFSGYYDCCVESEWYLKQCVH